MFLKFFLSRPESSSSCSSKVTLFRHIDFSHSRMNRLTCDLTIVSQLNGLYWTIDIPQPHTTQVNQSNPGSTGDHFSTELSIHHTRSFRVRTFIVYCEPVEIDPFRRIGPNRGWDNHNLYPLAICVCVESLLLGDKWPTSLLWPMPTMSQTTQFLAYE